MGVATIVANNIAILYGTETVVGMGVATKIIMIATSTAQSMGKAIPAIILSISRQGLLYIPLLLILNATLGFYGFIYAQPITDIIMRVLLGIYITIILKKEQLKGVPMKG